MATDQTYGESRVRKILEQLPLDEFTCYVEPRIGNDGRSRYPDFVVVWRSRGILAIEVKDWVCINKGNCDQENIEITKRSGEILVKENPARTAKKYSDNLIDLFEKRRELLSTYQGMEKLAFPCEGIVVLPNIDSYTMRDLQNSGIFPESRVFSGDALQDLNIFRRVLDEVKWTWALKTPMSEETVQIIEHTIKLTAVNIKCEKDINLEVKVGSLNRSQEDIIFKPLPRRDAGFSVDLVRGSVGSGKTVVLCKRAELLATTRPDLKVLITAFNLDLTRDLRHRIQNPKIEVMAFFDLCKKILGDKWPKVEEYRGDRGPATIKGWVRNNQELISELGLSIDYVAQEIARRKDTEAINSDTKYFEDVRNRKEPLSEEQQETICAMYELYREYQAVLKQNGQEYYDYEDIAGLTLRALFGHKLERYYDVIMIDEAQDWAPRWIQLIKRLLKPGGYLFICDDPAQSLWRFFNWSQKGLPPNYNKIYLELPERNTKQIMEFAQSLFDIDSRFLPDFDMDVVYPVKTDHLKSGSKPLVLCFSDPQKEYMLVSQRIEKLLLQGISGEQIGILCPTHQETDNWKKLEITKSNDIYVGHFNLMKGLEFNTVFIPRLDQAFISDGKNPSVTSSISVIRRLFVAMTRARENLIISCLGNFPEILEPLLIYADVEYL
jgi:hypothetical protein